MLSSTSNSEAKLEAAKPEAVRPTLTRETWVLLLCAVLVYACAEGAARFGLERISKIHQRIMTQQRAAAALRPASPGQPRTILLAGNSLLNAGLDQEVLEAELKDFYKPQPLIVGATDYYDWYYSLRSLFHTGMRPDVVVVALHAAQLTANSIAATFQRGSSSTSPIYGRCRALREPT